MMINLGTLSVNLTFLTFLTYYSTLKLDFLALFLFITWGGVMKFMFHSNYLLVSLLTLEFIMLSFLTLLLLVMLLTKLHFIIFLLSLTFAVCEACVGISILVSAIRLQGNESMTMKDY